MHGPSGVRLATNKIRSVLANEHPTHFIRADIKSFYSSIVHHKLIKDIKKHYDDDKLVTMLVNVINNPIDTPEGFINPVKGIPLRGPLSQFFSALYLKKLDCAFERMNLHDVRYQDDILILCQSKRQLNRARRMLMDVLQECFCCLAHRKTRYGQIEAGFHFLGISYAPTQPAHSTNEPIRSEEQISSPTKESASTDMSGEGKSVTYKSCVPFRITPHARTLRRAREQVKCMVIDEVSLPEIRHSFDVSAKLQRSLASRNLLK